MPDGRRKEGGLGATALDSAVVEGTGWIALDVTSFRSELSQGFSRATRAVLAEPVARGVAMRRLRRVNMQADVRNQSRLGAPSGKSGR